MAYNMKDVFYLDTAIDTTTSAGDGIAALDLSSYVDPIGRGRSKGTGLAIYKVFFDVCKDDGNSPISSGATGTLRAGIVSLSGATNLAVGSASLLNDTLNASNDLMIAGIDFYGGGTAAGDPPTEVFLEPSKEVPYIVVRDQLALAVNVTVAMSEAASVKCRLECAQVSLDQATLNQLLRTQTV